MRRISTSVRATDGIAVGRAYVVARRSGDAGESLPDARVGDVATERAQFERALAESDRQLERLAGEDEIFAAHLEMLRDEMLRESVEAHIDGGASAVSAVRSAGEEMAAMFAEIDDEYLRARVDDVRDIFARISANLTGDDANPFADVREGDILVADALTPSDMTLIDFAKVRGFVTREGSTTSHVCIIARNKDIPAVVALHEQLDGISSGDMLIVDGAAGEVIVAPDAQTIALYQGRMAEYRRRREVENRSADRRLVDGDGKRIEVFANAGSVEEIRAAIAAGADGIGLLRSEFIYMQGSAAPTEQQQYEAYAAAAVACGDRPLIIRTLDIGGDKVLPYMDFGDEENPFLGWRAIRVSLAMREMFCVQLRAILRAGSRGDVRVMFPMIVDIAELREAKSLIEECKEELRREGAQFNEHIRIGVMIETPAAVFIADALAAECDFFSIGTNDLTQYIMAADRANDKVAYLYNPYSDAVRSAIKSVIKAADAAGIECGMCGELASDGNATAELLRAGLREFSVNISSVGRIKSRIAAITE